MTQQRLPFVNADDGDWGNLLNQYIQKEHYNTGDDNASNGGHKTITIRPGSAASSTAPLKFTSGPLMTTPEVGAIEFLSNKLYFTQTIGTTRKTIAVYDDGSGAAGDIYYRNGSGELIRLGIGSTNDVLTVNAGIPAWQAPSAGSSGGRSVIRNVGGGTPITAANAAGTDYVYHIDQNLTLPDCTASTNSYKVRNVGLSAIRVFPNGAQTVAEDPSFVIQPFDSWEFITDTISNWGTF